MSLNLHFSLHYAFDLFCYSNMCFVYFCTYIFCAAFRFVQAVANEEVISFITCVQTGNLHACIAVAALHQGASGHMTWLADSPPWLPPWQLLCFGNSVNRTYPEYLIALFV